MQNKHDRDLCPTNSRSSVRWPPGPIPETTPEAMGAGASATLTGRRVELVRGKTAGPPPAEGRGRGRGRTPPASARGAACLGFSGAAPVSSAAHCPTEGCLLSLGLHNSDLQKG